MILPALHVHSVYCNCPGCIVRILLGRETPTGSQACNACIYTVYGSESMITITQLLVLSLCPLRFSLWVLFSPSLCTWLFMRVTAAHLLRMENCMSYLFTFQALAAAFFFLVDLGRVCTKSLSVPQNDLDDNNGDGDRWGPKTKMFHCSTSVLLVPYSPP